MGRAFRKTDLLCLFIGIIGLIITVPGQIDEVRLGIFGKRAEGKVVEVDERVSTPETSNAFTPDHYYLPTFEFTDSKGTLHKVKSNVRYTRAVKADETVEIAYMASEPSLWKSTETLNDPVSIGLFFFFVVSLLLGITGVFKHFGRGIDFES